MRTHLRGKFRHTLPLTFLLAGAASLVALEITLPEETARLIESPLPGYMFATTYCYTCHSVDYMRTQPPMTRAAWIASVTKMQKTFGAPIPDDAIEPIAEYLAKTYGVEREDRPAPVDAGSNAPTPTAK